MGRSPCCSEVGLNRGAWTAAEDKILTEYIGLHGEGRWRNLPNRAGLKRCGKSCRLRWLNYLRPDIKRGNISHDEEELIIRLHKLLGNRWSLIAGRLPGRTDNEIKNYWNTSLSKRVHDHHPRPRCSGHKNSEKSYVKKNENKNAPRMIRTNIVKRPKVISLVAPRPIKILPNEANEKPEQSVCRNSSLNISHIDNSALDLETQNNPSNYVVKTETIKACLSADDPLDMYFSALCEFNICESNDNNVDFRVSSLWDGPLDFCEEIMQQGWTTTDYPNMALDGHIFPSLL